MLVALGEGSGANGFKAAHDLFAVLGRNETLPEGAADEFAEGEAGYDFAGAIEADDAASGIEDEDEGADSVQSRVDEVAFDGEGLLDAAFGADIAFQSEEEGILIQTRGDLASDESQRFALRRSEGARLLINEAEETGDFAAGGGDGGGGVEADAREGADEESEFGIETASVFQDNQVAGMSYEGGKGKVPRKFAGAESGLGVDASAGAIEQNNESACDAAGMQGEAHKVIQGRVERQLQ